MSKKFKLRAGKAKNEEYPDDPRELVPIYSSPKRMSVVGYTYSVEAAEDFVKRINAHDRLINALEGLKKIPEHEIEMDGPVDKALAVLKSVEEK